MIRRRKASPFSAVTEEDEDINPIEMVANLSDVMLVLAVALMLAVITRSGLDFSALMLNESSLVPIEDSELDEGDGLSSSGSSEYVEVGKVYCNADGDMFLIED